MKTILCKTRQGKGLIRSVAIMTILATAAVKSHFEQHLSPSQLHSNAIGVVLEANETGFAVGVPFVLTINCFALCVCGFTTYGLCRQQHSHRVGGVYRAFGDESV